MSRYLSWIDEADLEVLRSAAEEAAGSASPSPAFGDRPEGSSRMASDPRASAGTGGPPPDVPSSVRPAPRSDRSGEPSSRPGDPSASGSNAPTHLSPGPPAADGAEAPGPPAPTGFHSVEGRVTLFAGWLRSLFGGRPFFVADDRGLGLWYEGTEPRHALWAPALRRGLDSYRRLHRGQSAWATRLDWEEGDSLEVLYRPTGLGTFAVGVYSLDPLSTAQKEWVARAMDRVFQP